jgi:hypothetical protein
MQMTAMLLTYRFKMFNITDWQLGDRERRP